MIEKLEKLSKVPGLTHGFSTTSHGNMGFRYGGRHQVLWNRGRFLRAAHPTFLPSYGVSLVPTAKNAGEAIAEVGAEHASYGMTDPESAIPAEAVVTRSAEVFLFLTTADCIPVILFEPNQRVLALVHAGRESTLHWMAYQTVQYMIGQCRADPKRIVAALGPGIKQTSYKLRYFSGARDPDWRPFTDRDTEGCWEVDLFGFNVALLEKAGLPKDNIEIWQTDTYTDLRFFSHRRSQDRGEPEGRHACAVGMVSVQ